MKKHTAPLSLVPVGLNATVARAYLIMSKLNCEALPVLQNDQLVGVVSFQELRKLISNYSIQRPESGASYTVGTFMNSAVGKTTGKDELNTAVQGMLNNSHSALVVSEGDSIIGVLTMENLLKYLTYLSEKSKLSVNDALSVIRELQHFSQAKDAQS